MRNGVPAGDVAEIIALINHYSWCLDGRDYAAMGACFAGDATFDSLPREWSLNLEMPARGPEAIVRVIAGAQDLFPNTQRRHLMSNHEVWALGSGRAGARSYFTLIHNWPDRSRPQLLLTGWYEDQLVRDGRDGWLFAERTVHRDGPAPPREAEYLA